MGAALKLNLIVCWGEKKAEREKSARVKIGSHEMNIEHQLRFD